MPHATNIHETDLRTAIADWDRAAFGVDCRRLEVLILRRQDHIAREVFERMLRRETRIHHTIDSPMAAVLPPRVVAALQRAGYETLIACRAATDEQLLRIPHFGETWVGLVRATIAAISARKPLPYHEDLSELYPDWPLALDCTCGTHSTSTLSTTTEYRMTTTETSRITEAFNILLEAGDDVTTEIDAKIQTLTDQIAQLKRMRRMLVPNASAQKAGSVGFAELEPKIIELLTTTGPLRAKEIGERLDINMTYVGRIAARSSKLARQSDGTIASARYR